MFSQTQSVPSAGWTSSPVIQTVSSSQICAATELLLTKGNTKSRKLCREKSSISQNLFRNSFHFFPALGFQACNTATSHSCIFT